MALTLPSTFASAYRDERDLARVEDAPRKPLRTPLAVRAARTLARLAPKARRASLSVSGLGCLTAAAWDLSTWAGLAAAGASLLTLEWLTTPDEQPPAETGNPADGARR